MAPHISALAASRTALPLPGTPRLKFASAARTGPGRKLNVIVLESEDRLDEAEHPQMRFVSLNTPCARRKCNCAHRPDLRSVTIERLSRH